MDIGRKSCKEKLMEAVYTLLQENKLNENATK